MQKPYPRKVLLAWAEAIKGNKEITQWLLNNNYKELGIFTYALRNNEEARKWLMENKHPELMACINGAEGNQQALKWLQTNNYNTLMLIAQTGDGDLEAFKNLQKPDLIEFQKIALAVKEVKQNIEDDNNDVHKISRG